MVDPAPSAPIDLNPPFGDVAYQPFGVFPASELARGLEQRILVVFHGFLSAIPNGYYKRLRAAFEDDHTVIGVNYAYFEPEQTIHGLDDLARAHLDGRQVAVFGSSLGGFWAAHFAQRIDAKKLILVNPATRPADSLGRRVGQTVIAERRREEFLLSADMIARYDAVDDIPGAAAPTLVLLARDDDLIDYRAAEKRYRADPMARVVVFDDGGHSFDLRDHPAMSHIVAFLREDGA